ncbi:hypothetical protein HEP84_25780 [Streptomyces sp. RLB1-33]|nr:hypothetical protein [Streptomyces sp. RLB1-33]QIY72051.1 hypothetical protein HEP84_25780 [Streptomyces sp. RLB1-33]
MGKITPELRAKFPLLVGWFDADAVEKLDQAEVLDRLDEAQEIYSRAFGPNVRGDLTWGFIEQAQAVCKAAPRDETERQAQVWVAKAEAAFTSLAASAYLEMAEEIRRENPQAPRRPRAAVKTPEQVEAERDVVMLKADVAKAAAAERARQAHEDAEYAEQVAGRKQWTVGAELRWRREHPLPS